MANHVYSYFEITFKSEEDCNNFAEWIGLDPKNENITWGERIEACCVDSPKRPTQRTCGVSRSTRGLAPLRAAPQRTTVPV